VEKPGVDAHVLAAARLLTMALTPVLGALPQCIVITYAYSRVRPGGMELGFLGF
jgi:hypothetical protein